MVQQIDVRGKKYMDRHKYMQGQGLQGADVGLGRAAQEQGTQIGSQDGYQQ